MTNDRSTVSPISRRLARQSKLRKATLAKDGKDGKHESRSQPRRKLYREERRIVPRQLLLNRERQLEGRRLVRAQVVKLVIQKVIAGRSVVKVQGQMDHKLAVSMSAR
jgi:hypothetical protein